MKNESGLLDNPNKQEGADLEQQDTLTAIKDDTTAIRSAVVGLSESVPNEIKQITKTLKIRNSVDRQLNKQLSETLKKGIALKPATIEKLKSKERKGEKASSERKTAEKQQAKTPTTIQRKDENQSVKVGLTEQAKRNEKQQAENLTTAQKIQKAQLKAEQQKSLVNKAKKETLPNGWKRDKDGRIRDKSGKYVSERELKKHGLKNTAKDNEQRERTEKLKSDRNILDALKGIQGAVESPENLDPLVNATQEIAKPAKSLINVGKAITAPVVKSTSKMLGLDKESETKRWRNRWWQFWRKRERNDETEQKKQRKWLEKIFKKPNGFGLFSRLLGLLALLAPLLSALLSPAKWLGGLALNGLSGLLGRTLLGRDIFGGGRNGKRKPRRKPKGKGGFFKRLGGFFKNLGKGGLFGGLLGGAKSLGKGILKRVPILGSLLAFADGGIGGGLGAILGGAIGSAFGPVGTVIGAIFGEKIGTWLADLNWSEIGKELSAKWQALTEWGKEVWNDLGGAFSKAADWTKTKWGEFTDALSDFWNNNEKWQQLKSTFADIWEGAKNLFSSAWDSVKDGFQSLKSWAEEHAPEISAMVGATWESAKEIGGKAVDFAKEKGVQALDFAKREVLPVLAEGGEWLWENGKSVAKSAWSGAKTLGGKAVDFVTSGDLAKQVETTANTVKNAVVNTVTSIFSNDAETVQQNIQNNTLSTVSWSEKIGNLLDQINGRIQAGFYEVLNKLTDLIAATNNIQIQANQTYSIDENGMPIVDNAGVDSVVNTVAGAIETAKAANYAIEHAAGKALGKCAWYVNESLRKQGIASYGHGKDVAGNLIKNHKDFDEVEWSENYIPQIGDVISMPSSQKALKEHKGINYGHAAIYTEKGWVSDFIQNSRYGNTGAPGMSYYNEIKSGKIKPTIARKRANAQIPVRTQSQAQTGGLLQAVQNGVNVATGASATGSVKGLTQAQTGGLLNAIAKRESGNDQFNEKNKWGYIGAYQFGASALTEVGLINKEKYNQALKVYGKGLQNGSNAQAQKAFLADPSNWNIKGGKQAFLASREIQDKAMITLLNRNANALDKRGYYNGSAEHKAGILTAAHLKGVGGAVKFLKGNDNKDGLGTRTSHYYDLGRKAVLNSANVAASVKNPPLAKTTVANTNIAKPIATYAPVNAVAPPTQAVKSEGNFAKMAQTVLSAAKPSNAPQKAGKAKQDSKQGGVGDPIMQFLTQDVSDRRIAHIVTGGLMRYNSGAR